MEVAGAEGEEGKSYDWDEIRTGTLLYFLSNTRLALTYSLDLTEAEMEECWNESECKFAISRT